MRRPLCEHGAESIPDTKKYSCGAAGETTGRIHKEAFRKGA